MVKYIIFDVGEVLIDGIKGIGQAMTEKYPTATLDDGHKHHLPSPLQIPMIREFFAGNVEEEEYLEEVIKTYPWLGAKSDLQKLLRENFTEIEGTRNVVLKLKRLGYKVGLLSVHGREWIEHCEKKYNFRFHKLFDVVSFSFTDGVLKPDREAFIKVMQKFPAKPGECLFIDDSPVNIKAAQELGIKTILFTSAGDLEKELHKMLKGY